MYIAEVRKRDGIKYPSKTMYSLLTGLLRYGWEVNSNFLDSSDQRFKSLQNAIDNVLCDLRQCGVSSDSKSADVFSKEKENQLWELGKHSLNNPKSFLCTVFFRNGEEHQNLKLSQVKWYFSPDQYVYVEMLSKNRFGGNKVVAVYVVPEAVM